MSSIELKTQIIDKINAINDELILEEIYRLVKKESELESIYKLSLEERKAIEQGLQDVKEGRIYSSEVAEKMMREWLKK